MRKLFVLLFFFGMLCSLSTQAQMSDFISLRKMNDKPVATYFTGSPIRFLKAGGQEVDGIIEAIRNDSVYVKQWQIQAYYTTLGTTKVDTVGFFIHKMQFNEIIQIHHDVKENWVFVRNGTLFMIAGAGYAVLNVINGAYLNQPITDPDNLKSLGIALGIATGGFIMNRIYKKKHRTGKKYKILYIKMTGK